MANCFTAVGIGYDVHAFYCAEGANHVMLCGIKILHTHSVRAHSDGDVALHALTDAILGAIGEGDIGEHFPPSDPKWKGASSDAFIQHALSLVQAKGGRLHNVDITIIAEKPHLSQYKKEMRQNLAKILGIGELMVNIKATTTEGLGFTGRKEGIAAQAICSVLL